MANSEQKNKNLTLGLILASVVLAFFIGFIVRLTYFGTPKRPQMAPISTIQMSEPVPSTPEIKP
jgi:hypothetical protein